MSVVAIIQARTGSSRLPEKSIRDLHGKPMLSYVIEFLKFCKQCDKIIVATSNLKQDDKIESICNNLNVDCFRGDHDNVLSRYYLCAKQNNATIVVRITADDPLIDPELLDNAISICKNTNCDYVTNMLNHTFPYGMPIEVIKFDVLEENYNQFRNDPLVAEHVTYHIRKNPQNYKIQEVFAPAGYERKDWRVTVDYIEDFELIEKIFTKLYRPGSFIKYVSLVEFLDNHNDLLKINSKYLPTEYLY
jgi:spore coat polysaccharide biosynthesis protein SpsF